MTGENRFAVSPLPGGSLTHAEARYDSPFGTVISGWERTADGTVFRVSIPANTEAELTLPGGTRKRLSAGSYSFSV